MTKKSSSSTLRSWNHKKLSSFVCCSDCWKPDQCFSLRFSDTRTSASSNRFSGRPLEITDRFRSDLFRLELLELSLSSPFSFSGSAPSGRAPYPGDFRSLSDLRSRSSRTLPPTPTQVLVGSALDRISLTWSGVKCVGSRRRSYSTISDRLGAEEAAAFAASAGAAELPLLAAVSAASSPAASSLPSVVCAFPPAAADGVR